MLSNLSYASIIGLVVSVLGAVGAMFTIGFEVGRHMSRDTVESLQTRNDNLREANENLTTQHGICQADLARQIEAPHGLINLGCSRFETTIDSLRQQLVDIRQELLSTRSENIWLDSRIQALQQTNPPESEPPIANDIDIFSLRMHNSIFVDSIGMTVRLINIANGQAEIQFEDYTLWMNTDSDRDVVGRNGNFCIFKVLEIHRFSIDATLDCSSR